MDIQEILTLKRFEEIKAKVASDKLARDTRLADRVGTISTEPGAAKEFGLQVERDLIARVEKLRLLEAGNYSGVTITKNEPTVVTDPDHISNPRSTEETTIVLSSGITLVLTKSTEILEEGRSYSNRPVKYELATVDAELGTTQAIGSFTDHALDTFYQDNKEYPYTSSGKGWQSHDIHRLFEFDESFSFVEAELASVLGQNELVTK
jgi:hypothetical protein